MLVLVTGATGLIGSAVVARLLAEGHEVVGIARAVCRARKRQPQVRWIALDMARGGSRAAWPDALKGVEAVVNCAGALQDSPRDSLSRVHHQGLETLIEACEQAGVRRFVQLSAIGINRAAPTRFSATKLAGDDALMASSLDWVILRPSVVVGRAAYGGSALFRGLAALPVMPVMPDTAALQIVQLDDVVQTVIVCLTSNAPSRVALDLAGPERLAFHDVVRRYRRWLGWPDAPQWPLPSALAAPLYWIGDLASLIGWRLPIRSTARAEVARGATGNPAEWTRLTGIRPRSLAEALADEPASVQERWFAGLYLLKALIFTVLPLFWIATGLISIGPGYEAGAALMEEGGAGGLAGQIVMAGGIADILIGLAIAVRRTSRAGLYAALALSACYLAAGTILLPRLWADPLGALLKALPIMVLNLVAIAVIEDR